MNVNNSSGNSVGKLARAAVIIICGFLIGICIGLIIRDGNADDDIDDAQDAYAETDVAEQTSVPIVTEPVSEEPEITAAPPVTTAPVETTPAATTEEEQEPIPEPSGTVRICLGGDTSIDTEFADAASWWGVDYAWKEVSEIFNSADISIVNLESCVSNRGESEKPEGLGFRTPPEMLEGFVNAGIDLVNLANNHTRDFGYDALLDTFTHLTEYGIGYFGAGHDIDEAQGLVVKEINGVKVGFVGCNYVWVSSDCAAAEDHAGINMVYSIDDERTQAFLDKVKSYDSQCDVLVAFMHCGVEEVFYVNSYQEDLSRALIDSGADIVVGAHPHTLQPIEFYNGKPIFYSIGNLIFWHVDDDIDGLTCIFDITIDKDGFKSLKLYPLFIKNYKVYLLDKEEDEQRYYQIIDLVNELCNPNGIAFDDDGNMIEYVPQEEPEDEVVVTEPPESEAA